MDERERERLNEQVAMRVFKHPYKIMEAGDVKWPVFLTNEVDEVYIETLDYCGDMRLAWKVVEYMRDIYCAALEMRTFTQGLDDTVVVSVNFNGGGEGYGYFRGDDAGVVICEAALDYIHDLECQNDLTHVE